jgi:hypothetical protein
MYFLNANCKIKSVKGETGWQPLGNSLKREPIIGEKKQKQQE